MNTTYNVLCVTKLDLVGDRAEFHLPITGEAVVSGNRVQFNGKHYELVEMDTGLCGTCVALIIRVNGIFNRWKLYTDTPAKKRETAVKIRGYASLAIERRLRF